MCPAGYEDSFLEVLVDLLALLDDFEMLIQKEVYITMCTCVSLHVLVSSNDVLVSPSLGFWHHAAGVAAGRYAFLVTRRLTPFLKHVKAPWEMAKTPTFT